MREAIERLIILLDSRRVEAYRSKVGNEGKQISYWHEGRANELGFVITRLKEVLAQHETGNPRDATEPE